MKKEFLILGLILVFCVIGVIYAAIEGKLDLVIFAASVAGGSFIVRKFIRK